MNTTHFDDQLMPNESILWSGQPQEDTFHGKELRLGNGVVWFIATWTLLYGAKALWRHGPSYSHGDAALVLTGLAFAILIKLLSRFSRSSAGRYWYAVTDKRVLAEFPDDGSQTVISLNIGSISKVTLEHEEGDVGTIAITTSTHYSKRVQFEYISDVRCVYNLLKQLT